MEQDQDIIKIGKNGVVFEGTRKQFKDGHFDNVSDKDIIAWCHEENNLPLSIRHVYFDTGSEVFAATEKPAVESSTLVETPPSERQKIVMNAVLNHCKASSDQLNNS